MGSELFHRLLCQCGHIWWLAAALVSIASSAALASIASSAASASIATSNLTMMGFFGFTGYPEGG